MAVLINLFAFQVGWLACVLGGAYQLPWLGTTLAAIFVGLHVAMTRAPRRELRLILLAGVIGTVWDSFLVTMGWLHYPSGTFMVGMAPHWIIALWMLFACTLNVSLRWLKGRWWLATASGALAGPLAYYAASRLGGVAMPELMQALSVLAVGWAVLLPLLARFSMRFDGIGQGAAGLAYGPHAKGSIHHV